MPTAPPEAFPFCGPSNVAESPVFDCQRSINLFSELGLASSKSRSALFGTPGQRLFTTLPTGPVRALWAGSFEATAGRLFAVGGSHVYEVFPDGTTQDYGAMAGSTGSGTWPCQFKENGTQLLVMDASCGTIFNIDGAGFTNAAVFAGVSLEYLDGFYVAVATPLFPPQNQINVSSPLDGSTPAAWPGLAFAVRTGSADLVTAIAVVNNQLWIFGLKTIEIWYNAGTSPFPFARITGATINQGLLAQFSLAKIQNSIIWLGADDRGWGRVYLAKGSQPVPVSTPAIESLINKNYGQFIQFAVAFTYTEEGHTFYQLNFDAGTVVYDITTDLWHERAYLNGSTLERSRAQCFASLQHFGAFNDNAPQNFVGDYANGRIYLQSLEWPSDNGGTIRRIRTAPHISNSDTWIKYPRFTLDADIGNAVPILDYSNDGGRTFQVGTLAYPMPKTGYNSQGGTGRYTQAELGRSKDRVFRVTINSNSDLIRLIGAYLDVNPGITP